NRFTGRAVWQSGLVQDVSRQKDRWVLGSGPYSSGSIRRRTELAGEELPTTFVPLPLIGHEGDGPDKTPGLLPTQAFQWPNADAPVPPQPVPAGLMAVTGAAPLILHPIMAR